MNKEDYDHRADIVKTSKIIVSQIAVAKCYTKYPNIRVIASQAADEMLNIGDIRASIVVYAQDGGVGISAVRSVILMYSLLWSISAAADTVPLPGATK